MPIYEYRCEACGKQFEKLFLSLHRVPAEVACPTCQAAPVQRLISAPAVHSAGEGGRSEGDTADIAADKPPVFGRKELNEAFRTKDQLRDQAQSGE